MPGIEDLERVINKLEEAEKNLKERIREGNETAAAIKEQRVAAQRMIDDTLRRIEDVIQEKVKQELAQLGDEVAQRSHQLYDKVGQQVDLLVDLCLGKHKTRRGNNVDLRPRLAHELRIWIKDEINKSVGKELITDWTEEPSVR